jgi:isopenicillin N synthase-like dioxygenase
MTPYHPRLILLLCVGWLAPCWPLSPPVIDISPLFNQDGSAKLACAHDIDQALVKFGVFVAVGHIIEPELRDGAIRAGYRLFDLPIESKQSVSVDILGGIGRGYLPFGKESGVAAYFEPKEGYSYGYDHDPNSTKEHPLQRHNTWPDNLAPLDSELMVHLYNQKIHVALAILGALTLIQDGLDDEMKLGMVNYLSAASGGEKISIMRLFHYFPTAGVINMEGSHDRALLGSSPHTDWGFLTLIAHDGVKGLQFWHESKWNDVDETLQPGGIVVNAGDYLHLLSGGRYHSPVHRVLCPTENNHRLSYVLFFYPNHNQPLEINSYDSQDMRGTGGLEYNTLLAGDTAVDETENKVVTFGDYIMKKWEGVVV